MSTLDLRGKKADVFKIDGDDDDVIKKIIVCMFSKNLKRYIAFVFSRCYSSSSSSPFIFKTSICFKLN